MVFAIQDLRSGVFGFGFRICETVVGSVLSLIRVFGFRHCEFGFKIMRPAYTPQPINSNPGTRNPTPTSHHFAEFVRSFRRRAQRGIELTGGRLEG